MQIRSFKIATTARSSVQARPAFSRSTIAPRAAHQAAGAGNGAAPDAGAQDVVLAKRALGLAAAAVGAGLVMSSRWGPGGVTQWTCCATDALLPVARCALFRQQRSVSLA